MVLDEKIGRNMPLNDSDEMFLFKMFQVIQNDDYYERWMATDGFTETSKDVVLF